MLGFVSVLIKSLAVKICPVFAGCTYYVFGLFFGRLKERVGGKTHGDGQNKTRVGGGGGGVIVYP